VFQLLDLDHFRRRRLLLRLIGGRGDRQCADPDDHAKHPSTAHKLPPEKKTRRTNQNVPAATTTTDPANTRRRPAASLRRPTAAPADATRTTISNCPIATPRLKENSDQPSARAGRSISRSTLANPKPCTKPNAKAIQTRTSRPPRTIRLSTPT